MRARRGRSNNATFVNNIAFGNSGSCLRLTRGLALAIRRHRTAVSESCPIDGGSPAAHVHGMSRGAVMGVVVVLVAAGGAFWWGQTHRPAPVPPATPPPPVAPPPAPPPPPPPAPAIRNPIAAAAASGGLPSLDQSDGYVKKALVDLVGRKAISTFFRLDGAIGRFVATVNNLATDGATADLWPVNRTPGRFETETRDGATVPSARNAERYAPFVRFAAGIDTERAVALYVRLYPLLQRAYENLGFPGAYLNDRVVAVIDNLLATPNVSGPLRVKRVGLDGGGSAGLYLYEDPALEAATAGQKILLRVGTENRSKLMAKLTEIRAQIATGPPGR